MNVINTTEYIEIDKYEKGNVCTVYVVNPLLSSASKEKRCLFDDPFCETLVSVRRESSIDTINAARPAVDDMQ